MSSRRCPNCRKRVPDGVVCCGHCGHTVPVPAAEYGQYQPLLADSEAPSEEDAAGPVDELGLLVAECPNCGGQAPRGWKRCPWCRVPLPASLWEVREPEMDPDEDGHPDETDVQSRPQPVPSYDYIDDPELLEQAEEAVRRLPLRLPFTEPAEEGVAERPGRWGAGRGAKPIAADGEEAGPVGWECPACGGHAERGWKICPWCDRPLPEYLWRQHHKE